MQARWIQHSLAKQLAKPFVHIVFGARQTGKTTLLTGLLPKPALHYNLADPEERTRHLANPGLFRQECEALPDSDRAHVVFIDEAQAVPAIFDAVQVLYDHDKVRWRFVLCGSSARKLRKAGANLLPGRCMLHRLFPLILAERPAPSGHSAASLPALIDLPSIASQHALFPPADIEERLAFGELPGITLLNDEDRTLLNDEDRSMVLKSFVAVHLEEEIRREALVKDWGDGGHHQYLPISYTGLLAGAAYSWSLKSSIDINISEAVSRFIFKDSSSVLGKVIFELGRIHEKTGVLPGNSTIFNNLLFWDTNDKKILEKLNVKDLESCLRSFRELKELLAQSCSGLSDGQLVKEELLNAMRMAEFGVNKAISGLGGKVEKTHMRKELLKIIGMHEELWLARNRIGGLNESSGRLRNLMKFLE
jgi:hypothetical protein